MQQAQRVNFFCPTITTFLSRWLVRRLLARNRANSQKSPAKYADKTMFPFYRSQLGGDDARQTQGKEISFENRDLRCSLVPERPKLCTPRSAKSAAGADAPIDGPQG
jgi:hypothetical protein